jgi:ferredoxin
MRVAIDADRCTGHGRCYSLAPTLFTDDERGFGLVKDGDVSSENLGLAEAAVRHCPEGAITLVDRSGSAPAQ